MNPIIQPLIPNLIPDWLDFFDNRAFTDNRYWQSCYCTYYQLRGEVKERLKPANGMVKLKNREAAVEMIKAGIIRGYLHYQDNVVTGWLNANDKTLFPTLKAKESAGVVLALMCFVIAPEARGQGVATNLLKFCIEDASHRGFRAIEGQASQSAKTEAGLHHGPIGLYESLGFKLVGKQRNQLIYQLSL